MTTYHLADHPQKAAERAAARKRLLHARFLSWSDPTGEWRPTPISALEHVVQASLLAAAPHGYRLLRPEGGEVAQLLGLPVPGGSLDNAAFYTGVGDITERPTHGRDRTRGGGGGKRSAMKATWAPRAAERDDDDEPGYEDWRDED